MGLSLLVGILADLAENDPEGAEYYQHQFLTLNGILIRRGFPPHHEPETCAVWSCAMYGYSGLHYLRRFAAYLDLKGTIPDPGDQESSKDPVLAKYYQRGGTFDHLIQHSDAEGYYLPSEFPQVFFTDADSKIAGLAVGSSTSLLAECERLAVALKLPAHLDPENEEVWEACEHQGKGNLRWKSYGIESFTCLCLLRAARHSMETGAAIVFT